MVSFWKHIRKENNARVPLATTMGGATGETDIAETWQDHYKSMLHLYTFFDIQLCKSAATINRLLVNSPQIE